MTEAEQPQPHQQQPDSPPDQGGAEAGLDTAGGRTAQPSRGLPPLPTISTVGVPSDPAMLARRLVSGPKRPEVLSYSSWTVSSFKSVWCRDNL